MNQQQVGALTRDVTLYMIPAVNFVRDKKLDDPALPKLNLEEIQHIASHSNTSSNEDYEAENDRSVTSPEEFVAATCLLYYCM